MFLGSLAMLIRGRRRCFLAAGWRCRCFGWRWPGVGAVAPEAQAMRAPPDGAGPR
ncbi:hypothetical protein ACU4GD_22085 [Cupriavidus basilensis]